MAWTYSFDYTVPSNSNDPRQTGSYFQNDKQALIERLATDHYLPWSGTSMTDTEAGEHIRLMFHAPISAPTTGAEHGALYTLDVNPGGGAVAMLNWKDEEGNVLQLTTIYDHGGGSEEAILNLTLNAFYDANGTINDDDTIEVDATNGLQLKAGGAGTGVLYTHCGTAAGDFVDDVTLEAAASGFQIKAIDESGTDADAIDTPVFAYGSYAGDNNDNRAIDAGIDVHDVTVMNLTLDKSPVRAIRADAGTRAVAMASGATVTDIHDLSSTTFQVDSDSNARTNRTGSTFLWVAYGVRA